MTIPSPWRHLGDKIGEKVRQTHEGGREFSGQQWATATAKRGGEPASENNEEGATDDIFRVSGSMLEIWIRALKPAFVFLVWEGLS